MSNIDISGVSKHALLRAMWENTSAASFFGGPRSCPAYDHAASEDALFAGHIDYFCGRPIKTDLSGDFVDFRVYDRDSKKSGASLVKDLKDHKGLVKTTPKKSCTFSPYGKPMIPGDPGSVLCSHCPHMKKQHFPVDT